MTQQQVIPPVIKKSINTCQQAWRVKLSRTRLSMFISIHWRCHARSCRFTIMNFKFSISCTFQCQLIFLSSFLSLTEHFFICGEVIRGTGSIGSVWFLWPKIKLNNRLNVRELPPDYGVTLLWINFLLEPFIFHLCWYFFFATYAKPLPTKLEGMQLFLP